MAVAAEAADAAFVYISTDYVFDGTLDASYGEYDAPSPLSVYGRTKWLGEQVVRDHLARFYIVRVAWLYGDGPRNFVKTVLRLADERGSLRMVTDEIGSPTYAVDVARALGDLIETPAYGTYQLPNSGVCSRYDWAQEILRLSGRDDTEVVPTQNYARAARVPKRVEMRNWCGAELGIVMRPWQKALADYIHQLLAQPSREP
jgi:dTDP-4-dehydrorhamnose reductase